MPVDAVRHQADQAVTNTVGTFTGYTLPMDAPKLYNMADIGSLGGRIFALHLTWIKSMNNAG